MLVNGAASRISTRALYYELVCKQNGNKVAYGAGQFDNDGTLLSSIVKNIRRVIAAEYSRELSVKVHERGSAG
jgi:hypothetical protein